MAARRQAVVASTNVFVAASARAIVPATAALASQGRGRAASSRRANAAAAPNRASNTLTARKTTRPAIQPASRASVAACAARRWAAGRRASAGVGRGLGRPTPADRYDARDVMVTRPGVADVVLRSPRRIQVLGMHEGTTDATFFDATGRRILSLNIRVDVDGTAVGEMISRVIPGARVRVEGINGPLVLSGQVANAGDADKAVQIARAAVEKPETQVINMIEHRRQGPGDAEGAHRRDAALYVIKQLGFNMQALLNGQVGEPQYLAAQAPTYGISGALLGGLTGGYNLNTQQAA